MCSKFSRVVSVAAVAAAVVGFTAQAEAEEDLPSSTSNKIVYPDEYSTDCYKGAANMIGHWDGIDNYGVGTNVSGATQWRDLKDLRSPWTLVSGRSSFTTNSLEVNGTWGHAAWMNTGAGTKGGLPKYKTFEICLRWDSGQQVLANAKGDYQHIFILNWGDGTFGSGRSFYGKDPNVKAGGSYRFAITFNGSDTPAAYYNAGTNVMTAAVSYKWNTYDYPVLASAYNKADCPFKGGLHAMRLYNRVLTADEIKYNAAVDKARFLGDTSELLALLPPIRVDSGNAFDSTSGKIVVSALVKRTADCETTLQAVVRRSDGVVTTNAMASAVEVTGTPCTYEVDDLVGGLSYDLAVLATDIAGHVVEEPAGTVFVGSVAIAAGDDANLNVGQKGSFTVTRDTSEAATANDLVVNYTIGGTAVAGKDYEPLSGSVTIPAGMSEVTVRVQPLGNPEAAADRTLTLSLGAGGYVPAPEASSATITVVRPDPSSPWIYDTGAKTLSDGFWTFAASGATSSIAVGKLQRTYSATGLLDFTKPILGGGRITGLGDEMLYGCSAVTNVIAPESVTWIGTRAFGSCSARFVRLNEDITSIADYAFQSCGSLTNVVPLAPAKLTYLGVSAYSGCGKLAVDAVVGTNSVTLTLGDRVFQSSGLTSIRYGKGVKTTSRWGCEWNYGLTNVVIDEGVQRIGSGSFQSCPALATVRLPTNSLTRIDYNAFYNKSGMKGCLKTIEPFLPKSLNTIGDRLFCCYNGCAEGLSDLELDNAYGKTFTYIGSDGSADDTDIGWMFERASCRKITVGRGMTKLPKGMFQEMTSVRELHFTVYPTTMTHDKYPPFGQWKTRQACVYVPAENEKWMEFLTNTTKVTRWRELNDDTKNLFAPAFPGYPRPYGLTTSSAPFGVQWIYKVNPPGMKVLVR